MIVLITIVIILACIVLGFFVLIQNPKGGGLAGNFGSIGTQVMGVKQSTDVMEKGTWTAMGIIATLCIACIAFYPKAPKQDTAPARQQQQQQAPAQQPAQPAQGGQPAQQPQP